MKRFSCFLFFALVSSLAAADIYVVMRADTPVEDISREALRDLYLGRTKALPSGEFVDIYDRAESSDLRAGFYQNLTGMNLRQVDAFWARLVFAGRLLPLQRISDPDELESRLSRNKHSLSYMARPPSDPNLKVVYRISVR